MPEIILDQAQVMPFAGLRKAAGMSQHVRIDMPQVIDAPDGAELEQIAIQQGF